MERIIPVTVRDKIAKALKDVFYVCSNTDYIIKFKFDEEWAAYNTKTARFKYNGTHKDVIFDGDKCPVPKIMDAHSFDVGVFVGDLHTTTPAVVPCFLSILSKDGSPEAPAPDVYAQIMEKLNGIEGGNVTPEAIAEAVEEYLKEHPIEGGVSKEEVVQAVEEALAEAKESGEFDGAPGKDGVDGKDGKSGVYIGDDEPTDPDVRVWINPDGDAGDVIELIETITLDEAMAIERSAEPDGTPYSFKRIVLMFEVPTGSAVSSGNIYFYNGDTGVGMGYLAKKEASASTPYLLNDCTQDAGRWLGRYMGGWTGNGNGVYTNNENRRRWLQYKVADYPTITRVTIPTLPAGTKVDVWGVRA